MYQVFTASAGQVVSSAAGGMVLGLVLAVGFLAALPRYMALWHRRFAWAGWQRVLAVMSAMVLFGCVATLGVCRGLQRSSDQIAVALAGHITAHPGLARLEQEIEVRAAGLDPASLMQSYGDAATKLLEEEFPLVATHLTAHVKTIVASAVEGGVATFDDERSSIADWAVEVWRNIAGAWIGGLRTVTIVVLIGSQGLFLGLMGFIGYKKNEPTRS